MFVLYTRKMGKIESKSVFADRHSILYFTVTLEETSKTFKHMSLSSGDRKTNSGLIDRKNGLIPKAFPFFPLYQRQ